MLTELEQKALNIIENYGEETEEYILPEISEKLGITINQVKGVVGSLVKKKLVVIGNCNGENTLIHYRLLN